MDHFFRTLIYCLTVGFARRCEPFGRRKVARILTCIKIISAFSAVFLPKGVRVLPTSCGRRTAGHDACYFDKEAENAVIFTCENVLQRHCYKQWLISPKYLQKRLKFRSCKVGGILSRYMDISRRNRRYFCCLEPVSSDGNLFITKRKKSTVVILSKVIPEFRANKRTGHSFPHG